MPDSQPCDVQFQPIGKRVEIPSGTSLIEAARLAGIGLASACGGEGSCGQCQVVVLEGQVTPLTSDEEFILTEIDRLNGLRLACCTRALGDVKVHVPKSSLITGQRLQIESELKEIDVDPLMRAYPLELPIPTLQDVRSDLTRILDGLRQGYGLKDLHAAPQTIRSAPTILRRNDWRITTFVRQDEIVGIAALDCRPLGFAVAATAWRLEAPLIPRSATGRTSSAASTTFTTIRMAAGCWLKKSAKRWMNC
jgi:uncharacterized 2Fe-2S/4Fe-4S cluster protein (DUF4445 family)